MPLSELFVLYAGGAIVHQGLNGVNHLVQASGGQLEDGRSGELGQETE